MNGLNKFSRRGFLKGLAGLAALTVAPPEIIEQINKAALDVPASFEPTEPATLEPSHQRTIKDNGVGWVELNGVRYNLLGLEYTTIRDDSEFPDWHLEMVRQKLWQKCEISMTISPILAGEAIGDEVNFKIKPRHLNFEITGRGYLHSVEIVTEKYKKAYAVLDLITTDPPGFSSAKQLIDTHPDSW